MLSKAEQEHLLKIARESVESIAKTGKCPEIGNSMKTLDQKLGAFVTLRKNGRLRGCIGTFSPAGIPLYQVVSQMAVAAATQDYRFAPVALDELPKISYEISVLSPLKKVNDWKEIRLGVHGVKVERNGRSGVFLPQVATETGWDLDEFMGELCSQKAGLPRDCWKDPATSLYTFTAEIFGDRTFIS
jgi:AmmeMemoRadiSam system protein A